MGSLRGEAFWRNEELLRESEERFRLLVEGVTDYAIFMLDPGGRVVTWNRGAERIKGYRSDDILGRHFSAFYTEADIERGHPAAELRIAAAEGSYEERGLRVRKDGSRFWANVVITALKDEDGDIRGFAKVTRDITERVEAEERERMLLREQVAGEQYSPILEGIATPSSRSTRRGGSPTSTAGRRSSGAGSGPTCSGGRSGRSFPSSWARSSTSR